MAVLNLVLPDFWPITEEVENPPAPFKEERWSQAAQFPPIQKLSDGRLVVEWWSGGLTNCERVTAKVWTRADHPNISKLPSNAPRAVKALYRADGQLALLRGNGEIVKKAIDAWDLFLAMQAEHEVRQMEAENGRAQHS